MDGKGDRAGRQYWERFWKEGAAFPASIGPYSILHRYTHKKYGSFFERQFSGFDTEGLNLLEVGCARSVWLPRFAKNYSFKVSGIDYSEEGCRQSRRIMEREGVKGRIVQADMFSPPESMKGSFDVVVSLGVIEHFDDTVEAVRAHSDFLTPGGILISKIPNLHGIPGLLLPLINSDFYRTHIPLEPAELSRAYRSCGLEVEECGYLPLLAPDSFSAGNPPDSGKSRYICPFINCVGVKESPG